MSESTIRLLLVSLFLWTAAIPDLKTKRIPVWIPAAFLAAALAADYCFLKEMSGQELRMGVIPGIILLLLSAISKGRIGEGDGICSRLESACSEQFRTAVREGKSAGRAV